MLQIATKDTLNKQSTRSDVQALKCYHHGRNRYRDKTAQSRRIGLRQQALHHVPAGKPSQNFHTQLLPPARWQASGPHARPLLQLPRQKYKPQDLKNQTVT